MVYLEQMAMLIDNAYNGIESYAQTLEDLSGCVLSPIDEMYTLTEFTEDLPANASRQTILELLSKAAEGAESYACTLDDTTDCTCHLDEIADLIGISAQWQ